MNATKICIGPLILAFSVESAGFKLNAHIRWKELSFKCFDADVSPPRHLDVLWCKSKRGRRCCLERGRVVHINNMIDNADKGRMYTIKSARTQSLPSYQVFSCSSCTRPFQQVAQSFPTHHRPPPRWQPMPLRKPAFR
jgi:hypothetical protein